jgi:hypothetical protein
MHVGRIILTVLIAVALGAFPLGRGAVHALPQHSSVLMAKGCCQDGGPCEHGKKDCGSSAACILKCSSLPASIAAPFEVHALSVILVRLAGISADPKSRTDNPPLPPPRV